jgi:hypothetical protein
MRDINYLKKSQRTLCPAGSVSVVQPSCCLPWFTQSLAFIALPVDKFNSQGINTSPAVHYFVRNLLWRIQRPEPPLGAIKNPQFILFILFNISARVVLVKTKRVHATLK